jgi:hypothetical protein
MPMKLINCISLPDVTITSLPIYDFAKANKELTNEATETFVIRFAERSFVVGAYNPSLSLEI